MFQHSSNFPKLQLETPRCTTFTPQFRVPLAHFLLTSKNQQDKKEDSKTYPCHAPSPAHLSRLTPYA